MISSNTSTISTKHMHHANILWDYLKLVHPLRAADIILCLGSGDLGVPRTAAQIWRDGWSNSIIMSGGHAHRNDMAATGWSETEAEKFKQVAISEGVPGASILTECRAENTGENFTKSIAVLDTLPTRIIVVCKPYMTRRGYATGMRHFPNIDFIMRCESITLGQYFARQRNPTATLNILVGDFHRIIHYPTKGFQIPQSIPDEAMHSYEILVQNGYSKHLT